ncbi:PAS domain S-box-containing protein [Stella humosa]|uniref:histidine kinase n=1 Tax=Stella humosa TaxID=94 RepID=A0A3N1MFI3_9PROT|nr:PAS domain S-box protein [Stella humosa]ROP99965.1 PAS domain S-box-containing protein [Stella humosa]BBK30804.1 hypothetical protein STHU_14380 [Stella humosa]
MTDIETLVRSFDWSRTSLGRQDSWPQSLRTTVDMVLQSPIAMVLMWGPDHAMVYNEGYVAIAGKKHPEALGGTVPAIWPEIWDWNRQMLAAGFRGEARTARDHLLRLERDGVAEELWFDLFYTPVRDESGAVAGVLCTAIDTTERVRLNRRLATESMRLKELFRQAPSFMAVMRGPDQVFELANDAFLTLVGDRDLVGRPLAAVLPELSEQGFPQILDRVLHTGEAFVGREMRVLLRPQPGGPAQERFLDFIYQRIDPEAAAPGIFIEGFDVTDRVRAEQRQAVLYEMGERLRELDQIDEIALVAAEMLGRAVGGARAGFATIDATGEYAEIVRDWTDGRVASVAGRHRLEEFGQAFAALLRRGDSVSVADVAHHPATAAGAASFARLGIRALLNLPVMDGGRLAAILYVHDCEPRAWSADDLALLRDGAARALSAIERAQARAASRASEALFQSLAEAAPQHVWMADADGRLFWFNARVYGFTGAAPGELDGEGWARVVHPEHLPAALAAWTLAVATHQNYQVEFRLRDATGAYRWFLARAVPVFGDGGQVIRWIGTNTDIDDQKMAVDRLAELNATLEERVAEQTQARERIWRVSQDMLVVTDLDGVWLAVNPAWEATLGWREHELVGRTSRWLEHPDDVRATDAERLRLQGGGRTTSFENRFRHRDGSYRWLSWMAVPEDGRFYAVARDVTAERLRQAELEQTQDALRQSQKMEAVGQLTGGIAHDFNNLLQGITGSLDLVKKRIAQGRTGELDRYVSGAMTSASRAAALTHRLLAFSRRQPLDPKPVQVNALVSSMEDLLRRTMGERIAIELVLAGGLWLTLCDQNQLESALLNLAINARDAMPDGGRLTIETANAHLDSVYVARQRDIAAGQYVCLCVTDTGTGMAPEVVQRAFDPFFTTKPIGQGTGLGLSMIYGFTRQSEGYAKIYSEVGRGTTVKLYLPRHRGGAVEADAMPQLTVAHQAEDGETVLVVEDEAVVRGLIVDVLQDLGYRALEAADGDAALAILRQAPRIDLLVTDMGLPGLNGRQIADAARERRPGLKVLFMTGYAENAALANGFLDPGMAMITKPFAMETLATRIRDMIET